MTPFLINNRFPKQLNNHTAGPGTSLLLFLNRKDGLISGYQIISKIGPSKMPAHPTRRRRKRKKRWGGPWIKYWYTSSLSLSFRWAPPLDILMYVCVSFHPSVRPREKSNVHPPRVSQGRLLAELQKDKMSRDPKFGKKISFFFSSSYSPLISLISLRLFR